ncbi:MAG: hypothetical protein IPJ74_15615 [Saprospiraceae bacterium]|nr:hypothetical protein [Saprospiraceae bacterium]
MQDLNNSSTHPIPGFEIVRNEENGFYYFQCKDINGKPILLSKDSQTQGNAENRLQNAIRLAKQAKNYVGKKEGEQYYFLLVGGNRKEIARSIHFKNEKDLQRTMDYVKQVANSAKAITTNAAPEPPVENVETIEQKPVAETSITTPQSPKKDAKTSIKPKYSFRIDLYPREEENSLSGRIEYLLSEEAATFQGVDGQAIVQFIKKNLPMPSEKMEKAERKVPAPPTVDQAELLLLSGPSGRPVRSRERGQSQLYFCLRYKNATIRPDTQLNARILISSVDGKVLSNFENKLKLSADKTAFLTLPGTYFSSGVYRVQVKGAIGPNADPNARGTVEANCLFQIFD